MVIVNLGWLMLPVHLCTYAPTYALMHPPIGLHKSFWVSKWLMHLASQQRRRRVFFFTSKFEKQWKKKYIKRAGSAALCELNPKTTLFTPSRAIQCELFHVPEFWKTHTRSSQPLVLQFSRFLDFHLVSKSWKLGTKQYNNMRDRQLSASYVDLRYCWPLSTSKGCRKLMTTKNN